MNKNILKQTRTRKKIKKVANGRYRLSIYRSLNNIYAQIIDDNKGTTIISSSTLDKKIKSKLKKTGNKEAAGEIGKILAEKAKQKGIKKVLSRIINKEIPSKLNVLDYRFQKAIEAEGEFF